MKHLFLPLFLLLSLVSCEEKKGKTPDEYLPQSSGTHTEMLLVVHDSLWRGRIGEHLLEVFGQELYGLPQPETMFSLSRIKPIAFTSLFKKSKSIVFAQLGDTTLMHIERNVWAKPQIIVTLTAPTKRALYKLIRENAATLVQTFHQADLAGLELRMTNTFYTSLPRSLGKLGIKKMNLNRGFEESLDKENLKIFRYGTKKTQQFLLFYTRPISQEMLPGQDIVAARDSIGKHYFQGNSANSYFATEMLLPPQQVNTEIDGQFAIETRGLWRTENDFMGGPFISYTIYRDNSDEVLCVEGFFYGPDANKKNVVLEMEMMMRSIKFK